MQKNISLSQAKKQKNDEFYTTFNDVKAELSNYKHQLQGKDIFCPCDYDWNALTPIQQTTIRLGKLVKGINDAFAFSQFLESVKDKWDIKSITYAHYNPETNKGIPFQKSIPDFAKKYPNGIVITNPPFSLFREFIDILMQYNLSFLVVGNKNAITYKEIFSYIQNDRMWLGYKKIYKFLEPNLNFKKFGNINWFTNLITAQRIQQIPLVYSYKDNPVMYPKYDNYNGINVDRISFIPYDYAGHIGVPITFLEKYNPEQFQIIGQGQGKLYQDLASRGLSKKFVEDYYRSGQKGNIIEGHLVLSYYDQQQRPIIPYMRIIIKNKNPKN
ncbi:adenine-specific methyltransferase EcoRI family protein [Candidatus Mycoplasma pogonae]